MKKNISTLNSKLPVKPSSTGNDHFANDVLHSPILKLKAPLVYHRLIRGQKRTAEVVREGEESRGKPGVKIHSMKCICEVLGMAFMGGGLR